MSYICKEFKNREIVKATIFLPLFDGFYETFFTSALNYEVEQVIDADNEENGTDNNSDAYNIKYDFLGYYKKIADHIFDYMKEEQNDLLNSYEFISPQQPREYNFSTDVINIEIDFNLDVLLSLIDENKEMLSNKIKEDFTPKDGYIPNTPNNLDYWIESIKTETDKYEQMISYILEYLFQDEYNKDNKVHDIIEKCEAFNFVECELK